ncbi:uncharacterized protein LOC102801501 [Saccoglossus kowalevskii]|uniref:Dentin sialophosphoprotein-like n=1 Tax=Saccoglossus kowalevskii TaxID=10224 RepID=A0ABM0MS08_SACKO|nr:PREDICTED: dentin sialophosphoprotein-like [Saccoglossus kowalevskii]
MGGCMAKPKKAKNGSSENEPYERKPSSTKKRGSSKASKKRNSLDEKEDSDRIVDQTSGEDDDVTETSKEEDEKPGLESDSEEQNGEVCSENKSKNSSDEKQQIDNNSEHLDNLVDFDKILETIRADREEKSDSNISENENNDEISNPIVSESLASDKHDSASETGSTHISDVKTHMDLLVEEMGLSENDLLEEIKIDWTSTKNTSDAQTESSVVHEDNKIKSVDSELHASATQQSESTDNKPNNRNGGSHTVEREKMLEPTDTAKQIKDASEILKEEKELLRKRCNKLKDEINNLFKVEQSTDKDISEDEI